MNHHSMDYLVVFERNPDGSYCVYVPDLPGCVSAGDSLEEAEKMIREAIIVHVSSLHEHGEPVPPPTSVGRVVHAA